MRNCHTHHNHHHHHILCEHQIEIEVWPKTAEVYYQDERYVDPVNTQAQFDAFLYNAPTNRIKWEVFGPDGIAPGAGNIDEHTGLYRSPDKGSYINGLTDIVVASSIDDPFRKATSLISLVGCGPAPAPEPVLEIYPDVASLYYKNGANNDHIDDSNKIQLFRTLIRNTNLTAVNWTRSPSVGNIDHDTGLYTAPNTGGNTTVKIIAELSASIRAEAKVVLLNYEWPGIV